MDVIQILFLFLNALVFTILFTMVLGNRGPWNNPMFFFVVLFLTSWTIALWLGQNIFTTNNISYLYGIGVTGIISLLLAASETPPVEPVKGVRSLRRIRRIQFTIRTVGRPFLVKPNVFFWVLLAIESCMIMLAYVLKYHQK